MDRLAYEYDVRFAEVGSLLGNHRRVERCARCGKPAVHCHMVRRKDGLHRRMAHVLQFYLRGTESRCVYAERCTEPCLAVQPVLLPANDNDKPW